MSVRTKNACRKKRFLNSRPAEKDKDLLDPRALKWDALLAFKMVFLFIYFFLREKGEGETLMCE